MKYPAEYFSNSENETAEIADKFTAELQVGDVVSLIGDLGAGKTFFTKKICESLGIPFAESPTFSIVNEYDGKFHINHFDFYRIKKIEELYDIGFEEYLSEDAITIIEWADLFPEILPKKYIKITIDFENENRRKITIERE